MVNEPKTTDGHSEPAKKPSKAWYLLPIFLGIIGGIVMYLVLKNNDRRMAKKGLIFGIILTVLSMAIGVVVGISAALLSHPVTPKLSTSECEMLKAELANSTWPSTATRQLMANGGCT